MRMWRHRSIRTLTALVATGTVAVAACSTASADLITNGVDDSVDSTVEVMPLSLTTGPAKTTIYVVAAEGDTDEGCNFDGPSETLTVNLASDNLAVATVSPTSLVLSACGAAGAQQVTVTPVGVGSATVTTSQAQFGNKTGGVFHFGNSTFRVNVTGIPNTPPELEVTGVEEGGKYVRGELTRPECVVTDVEDFPTPPHTKTWPAPMTEIDGPYKVDNIGTRRANCSYVDGSGAQAVASKAWSIVDETAPVISRVLTPTPDGSGWFREDVALGWTVTEAQSPSSLTVKGCENQRVTSDTPLSTFSCEATSAGGSNSNTVNIRRDATAPSVSPASTLAGGGTLVNGWYTSPVDVTFTASDATSLFLVDGRAVGTSSQTLRSSGDGEMVIESPTFTDRAGNSSVVGAQKRTVKVDTARPNAPTASFIEAGATGWHTAPITITFEQAGDKGSGVAFCSPAVTVDVDTAGETVSGTCTDHAGHVSDKKEVTVKLDRGAPVVTETVVTTGTAGKDGWYTSDVDVEFTATDALSGPDSATKTVKSSGEGPAVVVSSPAFTDRAGNTTTPAGVVTKTFKIDKTAPNAPSAALSTPAGTTGWHTDPVTVTFEPAGDAGSGVATCTSPVTVDIDTAEKTVSGTCTDRAGLVSAEKKVTVRLDRVAPVVSRDVDASGTAGKDGWYTSDVDVTFTATDALSGLDGATRTVTSSGEGSAVEVSSPAFTDRAGNTTPAGAVTKTFKVDKTAPATPAFVGAPSGSVYFGDALVTPTCIASDSGSGLASCVVTGDGDGVGNHTWTATATDNVGHQSTATMPYKVLGWTAKDFMAPIDMGGVFNTVKGGSTVPAKFEVFAGSKELTDTSRVTLNSRKISCTTSAPTDDIEILATGSTSLRYDTAAGQFQYNWKLPTGAGTCYELKMTAKDGSSVTANFKLK